MLQALEADSRASECEATARTMEPGPALVDAVEAQLREAASAESFIALACQVNGSMQAFY